MVPEARRVSQISYDEMLELATAGAGVMHNRSIEFAKNFSVPVHVRSSFSDNPGTMIVHDPETPDTAVCGAAVIKDEARVTVRGVPDRPGTAVTIFSKIAAKNIPMDMIVQNEAQTDWPTCLSRWLATTCRATLHAIEEAAPNWAPRHTTLDEKWPRSRWSAWAWPLNTAWPARCSARWPRRGSISR